MHTLSQDLRFAVRTAAKTPAFSLGVIATLALALGANAAIFSVVHAVLLRQLPFRDPARLVWVWSRHVVRDKAPFNIPDFLDFQSGNDVLEQFAGMGSWSANLTGQGEAERLQGLRVSGNLFSLLGVDAALGRTLSADDDRPGAEGAVVLTDGLWQRRFGGDRSVLGRRLALDGNVYTVVGVLPPGFFFPVREAEFGAPLRFDSDPRRAVRSSVAFLRAVGRLKSGVVRERAEEELSAIARRLQTEYPDTNARKAAVRVVPLADEIVGNVRAALIALSAAVGGVLLVACANLANLMLARGSARRKEMATRLALGATRGRLARQLLTENALFGLAGGLLGIVAAALGVKVLVAWAPADLPRLKEIGVDRAVLFFAAGLSIATGIVVGIVPAMFAARTDVNETLKEASRGSSEGCDRRRAGSVLVAAEIAIALLLSIVVGLFVQSFRNIQAVNPGFDANRVLSARISLPATRFASRDAIVTYQRRVVERIGALAAAESVGAVSILPLSGQIARVDFTVAGRPVPRQEVPTAQYRIATARYFEAMRIPLIRGRMFTEGDSDTVPPVALVNETLVRRSFAGGDPLGAHILVDDNDDGPRALEVVGIVGDVKHVGLDAEPTSDVYVPYSQMHKDTLGLARGSMYWVVRARSDASAISGEVKRQMQRADADIPIASLRPLAQYTTDAVAPRRFNLAVVSLFAVAALLLAAIGIYATLSYSLRQRAHEMAIRIALGAQRRDIVWLVVRQGLQPALAGIGIGLCAALALTQLLESLLFGLRPADPLTLVVVTAGLAAVALVAAVVPALSLTAGTP